MRLRSCRSAAVRSSGPIQRDSTAPRRSASRIVTYTSIFGIPVLCHAVATSPHGIVVASRSRPSPKSIFRVFQAGGTGTIRPFLRTASGPPRFSTIVDSVPRVLVQLYQYRSERHAAAGSKGEREMRRVWKAPSQMRGETVGWNDVEADAWEQHDSRGTRFRIARGERLEHCDLAGDVEIVGTPSETSVGHCPPRPREGPAQCSTTVAPSSAASNAFVSSSPAAHQLNPSGSAWTRTASAFRPANVGRNPRARASATMRRPVYPVEP